MYLLSSCGCALQFNLLSFKSKLADLKSMLKKSGFRSANIGTSIQRPHCPVLSKESNDRKHSSSVTVQTVPPGNKVCDIYTDLNGVEFGKSF